MKTITILYGSSNGNTEVVAEMIQEKLSNENVRLINVSKAKAEDIQTSVNLILGTSTWGLGDLQDDWEAFLPVLKKCNLEGKTVALFGLGDSTSFSETFVDGMGLIYETISSGKCKFTGFTDPQGYAFSESRALKNGIFVGLPLDENNESNLTEPRLDTWISKIVNDFQ